MVASVAEPLDGSAGSDEPTPPVGEWWSDEPPMESYQHLMQMLALIATLRWLWRDRSDYFAAGNLTVFYSSRQLKSEHFRGPDFFVVLGVEGRRPRRSWVVWEEDGRYPNVIVELLSDSTAVVDRGDKKRIYQDVFRTPEYFLFDPHRGTLEGFRLVGGRYEPIAPDAHGRFASAQLGLALGVREGALRFFAEDGALVPTPDEAALASAADAHEALRRADEALRRAEAAEAELARLRARQG